MKNKTNFLNAFLFSSLSLISVAQASNINDDEEWQQALALSMAQANDDEDLQQALALSMTPINAEISKNEKELEKVLETSKKSFNEAEDEELALALSMSTMTTNHEDKELKKALKKSESVFNEAEDEELALALLMSTQEDQYDQAITASLATLAHSPSNTAQTNDGVVAPVNPGLMNRLGNLEQSRRNISANSANNTTDELAQRLQRRRDLNGEGK